jgi:hypothetical protein
MMVKMMIDLDRATIGCSQRKAVAVGCVKSQMQRPARKGKTARIRKLHNHPFLLQSEGKKERYINVF